MGRGDNFHQQERWTDFVALREAPPATDMWQLSGGGFCSDQWFAKKVNPHSPKKNCLPVVTVILGSRTRQHGDHSHRR